MASASYEGVLYALVARVNDGTVLAEWSAPGATVNGAQALAVLEAMQFDSPSVSSRLATEDARESFAQGDDVVFHVVVDGTNSGGTGLAFVAAAPSSSGTAGPGAFLDEARGRTAVALASGTVDASSCPSYSLDSTLKPLLAAAASALCDSRGGAAKRLGRDLEELRRIMAENVERALGRGERIEVLVGRTDELSSGALTFSRGATRLSRRERWREVRGRAAAVAVVSVAVAAVVFWLSRAYKK